MQTPWFYRHDFGVVFLVCFVLLLGAGLLGGWLGRRLRRRVGEPEHLGLHGLDSAVLGLLALLIGFTLAMALSRYEDRRSAALDETNAIGTAWLRAQLLPDPERSETARLLRDYVQIRLRLMRSPGTDEDIVTAVVGTRAVQRALWAQALAAAPLPQAVPEGLFLGSLNRMFELEETRIAAARNRVPSEVFVLLIGVAVVGSAFSGYAAAIAGHRRTVAEAITSLLIACVIMTIFDLDTPSAGFIRVSPQPWLDLASSMGMQAP
jgi:hypothetical protein